MSSDVVKENMFYIEYRHCKFKARKNQKSKWNEWTCWSVEFPTFKEALSHLPPPTELEEYKITASIQPLQ